MLALRVPGPELHDDAAELLLELGGSAVQVEGDTLTSYFAPTAPPAPTAPTASPDAFAAAALGAGGAVAAGGAK